MIFCPCEVHCNSLRHHWFSETSWGKPEGTHWLLLTVMCWPAVCQIFRWFNLLHNTLPLDSHEWWRLVNVDISYQFFSQGMYDRVNANALSWWHHLNSSVCEGGECRMIPCGHVIVVQHHTTCVSIDQIRWMWMILETVPFRISIF